MRAWRSCRRSIRALRATAVLVNKLGDAVRTPLVGLPGAPDAGNPVSGDELRCIITLLDRGIAASPSRVDPIERLVLRGIHVPGVEGANMRQQGFRQMAALELVT